MTSPRDLHPLKGEAEFTWRGGDPTRVEALTDMVFAFALTLLVVSNAPPASFDDLVMQLWGFPGFAAAFAMLLLLWHSHYIFFRRYALQDGWTTTINAALLFLILFFVYPLKYMATMLSTWLRSLAEGAPAPPMSLDEAQDALMFLAAAYAAVFTMFLALYAHALKHAASIDLNARERQLTRYGVWEQGIHVLVGALVLTGALLLPERWAPFSGFFFFLIGPLVFLAGVFIAPDQKPAPMPKM